jgi:hypothetical protein
MTYPQQRRLELSWVCVGGAGLAGFMIWVAVTKDVTILWWLAAPFLVLLLLSIWKATRPNHVFELEQKRYSATIMCHPIRWVVFTTLGTVVSLFLAMKSILNLLGY